MRVFLAIAFTCVMVSAPAVSQRHARTSTQPVHFFLHDGLVNVLCARTDVNFNGTEDTDDSPAEWRQIDPSSLQTVRSYTFPWANVAASRVGWMPDSNQVFVGIDSIVHRYTITTMDHTGPVFEDVWPVSAVSATVLPGFGTTLFVSQRPSFTDPGYVQIITGTEGSLGFVQAGTNVGHTASFTASDGSPGLLVMSEGKFGAGDGRLDIWSLTDNENAVKELTVGDTPNHIALDSNRAYVTVNGSHWVVVVDLTLREAVDTILVGTSGFNGPRESIVDGEKLYVSTFAGDVRIFDIATGNNIGAIILDAKPEGMLLTGTDLWVTRTFEVDGYAAESNVVVYDLRDAVSVNERGRFPASPKAIFAPHGIVTLPAAMVGPLTLTTLDGRIARTYTVDSGSCTVNISDVPSGVYVISSGTHAVTVMR